MITKYKGSVEQTIKGNGTLINRVVFIVEAELPVKDCKLADQKQLREEVEHRFKLLTDPLVNENELTQTGKP